jgi:di/tricarboxylate transporter
MDIAIVLTLLLVAIVLFSTEAISVDMVTLLMLAALVITQVLTPAEAFSGFSSELIVILAAIFVLNGALQHAGLITVLSTRLQKLASRHPNRLLLALMATVGSVSAFMNNTTATALFVPPVMGVARRSGLSPSKLLIPLAYASILGGTCTLIGTSTNIAVSGYLDKVGHLEPLRLFEVTPLGVAILVVGSLYMATVGKRLLPDIPIEGLTEDYEMREYLSEILIVPNSHLVGQRMFACELSKMDFRILEVVRANKRFIPNADTIIQPNDLLLVQGRVEELMKVKEAAGVEIRPDFRLGGTERVTKDIKVAEALVNPRAEVIGRTLKETGFRQRFGLTVLAIYRRGESLRDKIGEIKLQLGDLLLVQGTAGRMELFRQDAGFAILGEVRPAEQSWQHGLGVAALFAGAITLGGASVLPLSVALLIAAVLTVVLRFVPLERAYELVDWRLLILIGGMTAFGLAMQKTGAAEFLAHGIVQALGPFGPGMVLAGFFVLTVLLTQPMSNAAAALVVLPVALQAARDLGANPRTFAIAVMLAASISLIAPMEPSCILVYGPGKYRFNDFVKAGLGLTVILCVLVLYLIPFFWPLQGVLQGVPAPALR